MIKIMIVDDETEKISRIMEVLSEIPEISLDDIVRCLDINAARREFNKERFDLVILDIQLPQTIGTRVHLDGGVTLLHDINAINSYKKPTFILGITSNDDTKKTFEKVFADELWTVLNFDPKVDTWKNQLMNKVTYLLDWKAQEHVVSNQYNYDVAIVTAVDRELQGVLSLPGAWEKLYIDGDSTEYYKGIFTGRGRSISVVVAKQHQMGLTAASVLSMKLIYNFRPKYIAAVGILAGNKDQGVNLGDIIVSAESWDYGSGKIKEEDGISNFMPDPRYISIDIDMKEMFDSDHRTVLNEIWNSWVAAKPQTVLRTHVGPVASGAAVIQDKKILNFVITHNRKLLGIDMETYGIYFSAQNAPKPRPTAMSMKSVSDFADSAKSDQYQEYAAYTSARMLFYVVTEKLDL